MAACFSPASFCYCVLLIVTVVLQLTVLVDSLPVKVGLPAVLNDDEMAAALVLRDLDDVSQDLDNVIGHPVLDDLASSPGVVNPHIWALTPFFPQDTEKSVNTPTDTPTLIDLIRSVVRKELTEIGYSAFGETRKPDRLPEGRQLYRKRSFDSISRSSGFGGMPRSSWGGGSRGGENLTFTFESLFPAIARGLRSIN